MKKLLFFSLILGISLISCRTQKSTKGEAAPAESSAPSSSGIYHDTINKKAEIKHQGKDQKSIDSIKEIKNRKKGH